jgi:hypothetical protein|tara:strand:+ start:2052 stop:4352 length:2301 start_codon:yes stop_codon:yes gene_type:complete
MAINKSWDRSLIVIGGSTMADGGSLNLSKGQFGIFDEKSTSKKGLKAVDSFEGVSKRDSRYAFKLGIADRDVNRSQSNKSYSSFPFSLNDVEEVGAYAPELSEQIVDELIIGYNGVDPSTSISMTRGQEEKLFIQLSGKSIGLLGYNNATVAFEIRLSTDTCPVQFNPLDPLCEDCDPCAVPDCLPIILDAIEQINEYPLKGMVRVKDVIEATPIHKCDNEPTFTTQDVNFYSLEVCDTGDQTALSIVQAQYPDYKVLLTDRKGANSTYQVAIEAGGSAPTDLTLKPLSLVKGCDDCPSGYTAVVGGEVYFVTLDDAGADASSNVQSMANAVATTAEKTGGSKGEGSYIVLLTTELSDADKTTFLTANKSATIEYVGSTAALCDANASTTTSWSAAGSCTYTEETYTITIPDTVCKQPNLAAIQAAYPDHTIVYAVDTAQTFDIITVAGTSGTSTVTINGVAYTMTFDTDIATTMANFVTASAAAILSDSGLTMVVADATTLTLASTAIATGTVTSTVANATGDLAGTVVSATVAQGAPKLSGGCQTAFTTTVNTNVICEQCDPIFEDTYRSEAPVPYLNRDWTKLSELYSGVANCLCGIRLKGKKLGICADDTLRDLLGFEDTSVKIQASFGHIDEVREAIGGIGEGFANIEYLSYWQPRTNMGGEFYGDEDSSRMYFQGESRNRGAGEGAIARMFKGTETHLEPCSQYVDYWVKLNRTVSTQGFASRTSEAITYHIVVEYGKHQAVEAIINSLAGAAGVGAVKV